MILGPVFAAIRQVMSPPLRRMVLRSLGLTIVLLIGLWGLLTKLLEWVLRTYPISRDYPLVDGFVYFLGGAGLVVLLVFLLPPVLAFVGGFFVDDAAAIVERTDFPHDRPGEPQTVMASVLYGLRFAGLALLLNLAALTLIFIPFVNIAAFFAVNTYLLGREYFEMAAARFRPAAEATALRRANRFRVMSAGAVLAGLMLVPVLNLLTPIFGIALMVHVHKRIAPGRAIAGPSP
nr:sulfate transporter family protein [Enterovirga rhinocerotis]